MRELMSLPDKEITSVICQFLVGEKPGEGASTIGY